MRISGAALDLVAAVELQASKPRSIVEAEIGSLTAEIDAKLDTFVRAGLVMRAPFIDPFRLGLECYSVGFRVHSEAVELKYLPLLVRADQVAWVRRHHAGGHYSMGIAAPSISHVVDLFDDFLIGLRHAVSRTHFLVAESWMFFGHKTVARRQFERTPLRAAATHERPMLDEFERRIIAALLPRRHFDPGTLARELRIDEVELGRCIERLRRLDIIRGFTYRVAPAALGRRRFDILVRRRTADVRVKRDLERFAEEYPHISGLINFLGEWDHELTVEVEQRRELGQCVRALLERFGSEIERLQWRETVEELSASNVFP